MGRTIGYPTINFRIPRAFSISFGVYTCRLSMGEKNFSGILYYGPLTLVDKKLITLEVHLLPSRKLTTSAQSLIESATRFTVCLGDFIRGAREFKTLAALKKQISSDIKNIPKQ